MKTLSKSIALWGLVSTLLFFTGCGNEEDNNKMTATHQYEVTVTNLTAAQPFSPAGAILHGEGYHTFRIGEAAGSGLEQMAEGGDLTTLMADAEAMTTVYAAESGTGIILPGASETIMVESLNEMQLSVVSMLVNTNDAFIALDGADISGMDTGETMQFYLNAYDAGTEKNSESASTIPGPAGNGEGYNAARDDSADSVTLHPGVVTADDGLAASALTSIHKWDNPTAKVSITRTR